MTLIEKTLKEFDERKHNWRKDFDFWEADMKDVITQALQEQDRESRREILKGIETYWNDNNYDEISSGGLIKHLGLDLKQDEN